MFSDRAIGLAEDHVRARELVISDNELAGVDEAGGMMAGEISSHDHRGKPFSEACNKIERAWWTMTQQLNAVQCIVQIRKERIDLR
jgi:hypothetical protein